MTIKEKIELALLLAQYQAEKAEENLSRKKDKRGDIPATKALFNHARILQTKLSVDIANDMKSTYQIWAEEYHHA